MTEQGRTASTPKKRRSGATVSTTRRSATARPIMQLLDLLGRRWALRVLWEMREGDVSFRVLRERCDDVSPSVLNARLAELRDAGLVESGSAGYLLSARGRSLGALLLPLNAWSRRWAARGSSAPDA